MTMTVAANQKIPTRYKQTEIGVIPIDWDVEKLSGIAPLQRGFDLPASQLRNGTYPVVYSNGILNFHNKAMAKAPGVVTGRSGTIGKVNYIEKDYWPHNTTLWVTNFKGNDERYVYYLYSYLNIERFSTGSGVPTLNRNDVHDFKVGIPKSKIEQTAIATTLFDTDVLINKLEKLIKKKKNIKQGVMQELLTRKKRLPGFSGKWETTTLGKVANFEHGYGLSKSDLADDGHFKCIHYGQLFTEYKEMIGEIKSKTNINVNNFYSKENDVLMPTSDVTPRGLATASCIKVSGIILGGGILVIRLHSGYDGLYLSYFITQNKNSVLQLVKGSTVFHLYAGDLANLEIIFPKHEEQKAIAKILSGFEEEIEKLESQLTKYKNIKQGMMQKLLTGKIRLLKK